MFTYLIVNFPVYIIERKMMKFNAHLLLKCLKTCYTCETIGTESLTKKKNNNTCLGISEHPVT